MTPPPLSDTILYLMRHGAIDGGSEKRFIGQIDLPLSTDGRMQSERQARLLKEVSFTAVWCSDLNRAYATAAIVCQNRGLPIRSAPELREIHLGSWDGIAMEQIRRQFPELWQARGQDIGNFRPPGAESFSDLQQRTVPFIHHIAASSTGNVLIVTHAGVIRVLLCALLQMPLSHLFRFHLDYGGLTFIKNIHGKCRVLAINRSPALPTTDD